MMYRHHHHCLSKVHKPPRWSKCMTSHWTILILGSESSNNSSPWLPLSWTPYHILKVYQMSYCYPILHYFILSEDNNVISISHSQLWRKNPPSQVCPSRIKASCLELISSICQLPTHQWRYIVAAPHHFVLALIYSDTSFWYALSSHEILGPHTNKYN